MKVSTITLRRVWLQVHKWIGLTLAALIIPIGLSGAALVWDDGLDRLLNPARHQASGAATLPPAAYAAAARTRAGPARLTTLTLPARAGDPVVVTATTPATAGRRGPAPRLMLYLDPPTARVLAVADARSGVVGVLHRLHGSLMIPGIGRAVVGWVGVAMLVSTLSGLWLWWPAMGGIRRGLRWRRQAWVDANLHHLAGFWIALPLFVLSLTGAWISFPGFFGPLVGAAQRAAPSRDLPRAAPRLTLAEVTARLPAGARIAQINWPGERRPVWLVTLAGGSAARTLAVDDGSGRIVPPPPEDRPGDPTARLMRRIHDGTGMGPVWQGIIVAGGVAPALLAVTGMLMWWRARRWRRRPAARAA